MNILHLFELHLPHTMNWAARLMQATPDVRQWVAAPWILDNEYHHPEIRFFIRPLQQKTGWIPKTEQEFSGLSQSLIYLEKRLPLYQNWLLKQIQQHPPDLLHAHFGPTGCQYRSLAKRLKIPLVCSFYGYDLARVPFEKPQYQQHYRALFEQAAAILTTGDQTQAILEQQGCPKEKIHPIPLGIFPSEFPFLQRQKQAAQLRLVQVATITEKKGHMDALKALAMVLPDCPNIQFTIAGERQDRQLFAEIQQFIQDHGLGQNVQLEDFVPHAALPAFFRNFDLFVHPSRSALNRDCEGAPVVILEAMASGLPVLSCQHADIPNQVIHERTGLLAPERDPACLANYLQRFYHLSAEAYEQMSQAGRLHVEQKFDLNQIGPRLSALYHSWMARP